MHKTESRIIELFFSETQSTAEYDTVPLTHNSRISKGDLVANDSLFRKELKTHLCIYPRFSKKKMKYDIENLEKLPHVLLGTKRFL